MISRNSKMISVKNPSVNPVKKLERIKSRTKNQTLLKMRMM